MKQKTNRIDDKDASGKILEYLLRINSEGKNGSTIYEIKNKAFSESSVQKEDRVKKILVTLVEKKYVEFSAWGEKMVTFYSITEEGKLFYYEKLKAVLDLFKK